MTLFSDQFKMSFDDNLAYQQPEIIVLASLAGIDSSKWELSLHGCNYDKDMEKELQRLSDASHDRNIFYDPAFFSASQERLGLPNKRVLVLTEVLGNSRTIKLAVPIQQEKVGLLPQNVWRVWSNPFAPLSTPLIDGGDFKEVISKFCQLIPLVESEHSSAILFQDLPMESDFFKELLKYPDMAARMIVHGENERSTLLPDSPEGYMKNAFSKKRARELRRQFNKLGELGELQLEKTEEFWEVMIRFEEFLLLETKSWKGRRGTSIHVLKRTAAFARQAVANLVTGKNCSIYSIRLDGKVMSSMIVFKSRDQFYLWKIAFAEDFARYSVGKQLAVFVTKDLLAQENFKGADSLATSDNNLMNQIWFDRMKLCNLTVGLGESVLQAKNNAQKIVEAVDRKDGAKTWAKSMIGLFRK
ncbi:MAG: GNAT family N-acetyltransferase [Rhizobiaceae bacterium]